MKYRYQKPHTSIAGYVQTVLVLHDAIDSPSSDLPLPTNGFPALLCQIGNNTNSQLTIFGQSIPAEKWATGTTTTLAYFFKPFALGTVFGISARELKDKPIELHEWNAKRAVALDLQLLNADTIEKQTAIFDNFLSAQILANKKQCETVRYATDQIMYDPGADVLSRVLAELKLTERTFQRIFKRYVGITPNEYRRICQFYSAFSQLKTKDFNSLTNIAYANGYSDQSHYIRSFKEFAGTTPNDYLQTGLGDKK